MLSFTLQFYKTCRKIFKILWLVRRSESREERRVMIEKKAAALGGDDHLSVTMDLAILGSMRAPEVLHAHGLEEIGSAFADSGISQSSDQGFPTTTAVEDTEEEDGFGDGDPSEVREFMEELGASGDPGLTSTATTTPLPSIPTMIALGVVSFSAGLWKLLGDLSDIMLMSSPLGARSTPQNSHLHDV